MPTFRLALANVPLAATADESVVLAQRAIRDASAAGAELVLSQVVRARLSPARQAGRAPDADCLEAPGHQIAAAAAQGNVAVVLGTKRLMDAGLLITALVINQDGSRAGFQDKVQIDPSEEITYACGEGRRVFQCGALTFGISICHERVAVPRDRALGRKARRAHRLPSPRARGGAWQLPPGDLRRSGELVP